MRSCALDAYNNTAALAERHLSEKPDGTPVVSIFGPYDPRSVGNRLEFGLQFLFQSTRKIHGAFRVPAPEVEALATRFEDERRQRVAAASKPHA